MKLKSILILSILGLSFVGVFVFGAAYDCSIFMAIMGNCEVMSSGDMTINHLSALQNFSQNLIIPNAGLSVILALFLGSLLLFSIKFFTYFEVKKYSSSRIDVIIPDFSFEEKILSWLSILNLRDFNAFLRVRVLAN